MDLMLVIITIVAIAVMIGCVLAYQLWQELKTVRKENARLREHIQYMYVKDVIK